MVSKLIFVSIVKFVKKVFKSSMFVWGLYSFNKCMKLCMGFILVYKFSK